MQRLRIRFRRGEEIKYISHLDMVRLWQRALTRAGIDIAYSEGYNPHPRLSLAAPLALGVTSEAELMDAVLARNSSPHYFTDAVNHRLPSGVEILQAHEMPLELPSLQSQIRAAEYQVELEAGNGRQDVKSAIDGLLALGELPWQHMRDTGPHRYDLRRLIDALWLVACEDGHYVLGMRLRCDNSGTGRPEQVALALGFKQYPLSIHRTKLILQTR